MISFHLSWHQGKVKKEIFSSLSKNLKDSIHDTSEKAADFINSLKKDKIRSLEKLLNVDKKDLMTSNKKKALYTVMSQAKW